MTPMSDGRTTKPRRAQPTSVPSSWTSMRPPCGRTAAGWPCSATERPTLGPASRVPTRHC